MFKILLTTSNEFPLPVMIGLIALFIVIGMVFITIPAIISLKRKKYTKEVTGTVISVDSRKATNIKSSNRFTNVYCPIYKYRVNGIEYTYNPNFYRNYDIPHIGDEETIYINEENPEDVYIPQSAKSKFVFIFIGSVFVTMSIIMLMILKFV